MHPGELVGRIRDIEWDSEKVFATLDNDVQIATRGCEMIFGRSRFESFSDKRQRGLVNMCFQMGTYGLQGFERMIDAIFKGDWAQAHNEALDSKWARSDSPKRAQRVAKMILEG
jgi:lysozyme